MLAMVGDEYQTDWDIQLPHVESASNNAVSAATGLAPTKGAWVVFPASPLPSLIFPTSPETKSLNRNQLDYIDLATDWQQSACRDVRELHAIYESRLDHRNPPLTDALRLLPPFSVNGRACIYNSAATIRQGARKGIDHPIVLKTKLSWIGTFKILAVGQVAGPFTTSTCTLLSRPMPRRDSKPRVSVPRSKPCRNPVDI